MGWGEGPPQTGTHTNHNQELQGTRVPCDIPHRLGLKPLIFLSSQVSVSLHGMRINSAYALDAA